MAQADIQRATRRLRRMEELLKAQTRRLARLQAGGNHEAAARAAELLRVFEGTVEIARRMLERLRRGRGAEDL